MLNTIYRERIHRMSHTGRDRQCERESDLPTIEWMAEMESDVQQGVKEVYIYSGTKSHILAHTCCYTDTHNAHDTAYNANVLCTQVV